MKISITQTVLELMHKRGTSNGSRNHVSRISLNNHKVTIVELKQLDSNPEHNPRDHRPSIAGY